jgi:50S ribosomal subunit-associated GTPase HflX
MVFNKMDLADRELFVNRFSRLYPEAVFVSAKGRVGPRCCATPWSTGSWAAR